MPSLKHPGHTHVEIKYESIAKNNNVAREGGKEREGKGREGESEGGRRGREGGGQRIVAFTFTDWDDLRHIHHHTMRERERERERGCYSLYKDCLHSIYTRRTRPSDISCRACFAKLIGSINMATRSGEEGGREGGRGRREGRGGEGREAEREREGREGGGREGGREG